ncbi:MAG: flagellar hook-basal body protein [Candidatus Eremiobacteraeota bacterium]|nr:flagellar hook-basal body protein [Candidatus Eremiobacteraeota bacterium]
MLDGMKAATEGMLAMSVKQDIIANNLANAGTAGFRKEEIAITSFTEILDREVGGAGMTQAGGEISNLAMSGMQTRGTLKHTSVTHTGQGPLKETGNAFDLALNDEGKGFFTIQTPDKGIQFTRAGSFHLSTEGFLVTGDGSLVMGHKGPIKLDGSDFKINNEGVISVNDKEIDKLLVCTFDDPAEMKRTGATSFVAGGPKVRATTKFQLKQGYLEQSNVNALQEMVGLMQVMRNYEANQKALQAHDSRLQKAVNELGRVR